MLGRGIKVELHLVGCNGQLYVVMGTEEDTLTRDKSLESDLFELPVGCKSFLKVAETPLRFFTEMSRESKYRRHNGQWYQGWLQEMFCCTAKGRRSGLPARDSCSVMTLSQGDGHSKSASIPTIFSALSRQCPLNLLHHQALKLGP